MELLLIRIHYLRGLGQRVENNDVPPGGGGPLLSAKFRIVDFHQRVSCVDYTRLVYSKTYLIKGFYENDQSRLKIIVIVMHGNGRHSKKLTNFNVSKALK